MWADLEKVWFRAKQVWEVHAIPVEASGWQCFPTRVPIIWDSSSSLVRKDLLVNPHVHHRPQLELCGFTWIHQLFLQSSRGAQRMEAFVLISITTLLLSKVQSRSSCLLFYICDLQDFLGMWIRSSFLLSNFCLGVQKDTQCITLVVKNTSLLWLWVTVPNNGNQKMNLIEMWTPLNLLTLPVM